MATYNGPRTLVMPDGTERTVQADLRVEYEGSLKA